MKEYIERGLAQKVLEEGMTETATASQSVLNDVYLMAKEHAKGFLSIIPTADVVSVVRCKNCKYYEEYHGKWECNNLFWNNEFFPETKETDFCSYGERRE